VDPKLDLAVIEQQFHFRFQGGEDFRMRQRGTDIVALYFSQLKPERISRMQVGLATLKLAKPQLRPLQIEQDTDRPVVFLFHGANDIETQLVLGVSTMGKIEPENIDSGEEKIANAFLVRSSRAQRRDNLGVASASHKYDFQ